MLTDRQFQVLFPPCVCQVVGTASFKGTGHGAPHAKVYRRDVENQPSTRLAFSLHLPEQLNGPLHRISRSQTARQ